MILPKQIPNLEIYSVDVIAEDFYFPVHNAASETNFQAAESLSYKKLFNTAQHLSKANAWN